MRITIPKKIEEDYVFTILKDRSPIFISDPMYMEFLKYVYQMLTPEFLKGEELDLDALFKDFLNTCGLNTKIYSLEVDVKYDYDTDRFLNNPILDMDEFLSTTKLYGMSEPPNLNGLSITEIMEKNGIERNITTKGFTPVSFGFIGESPYDK